VRQRREKLARNGKFAQGLVGLALTHAEQPAKTALFAGGNEADVRKRARECAAPGQPAKTTLFAGGNEADVRKTAAGRFSN
jgi:hypothetical protein